MSFSETPEADALPNPTRLSGQPSAAQLREDAATARRVYLELQRQAEEAVRAERIARTPKMPTVDGDLRPVVLFDRYQSGRSYSYAAIGWREGRSVRWAVTGSETRRFNWPGLLEFIGEANWGTLRHAVTTTTLLPEGAEPPVAERMGSFGRVLGTDTVDTVSPFTRY